MSKICDKSRDDCSIFGWQIAGQWVCYNHYESPIKPAVLPLATVDDALKTLLAEFKSEAKEPSEQLTGAYYGGYHIGMLKAIGMVRETAKTLGVNLESE